MAFEGLSEKLQGALRKMTGKGKHDFIITVTDNEGVSVTRTLLLVTE